MTKRFAVFDIDGTLIRWQMMHALMDQLGRQGHLSPEHYTAMLQARQAWKERQSEEGFHEYELHLIAAIEHSLVDIPVAVFRDAAQHVFERYRHQVYRYTRDLIEQLKQRGYFILAISGSPEEIVGELAREYGFDDFAATEHVHKDGVFTGEIRVAVYNKPKLLRQLAAKHHLDFAGSIGVGDSEGDIAMLDLVEQPIAFNPSKKLFQHAQAQGWRVVVERKNMIYSLEQRDGRYVLSDTNAV